MSKVFFMLVVLLSVVTISNAGLIADNGSTDIVSGWNGVTNEINGGRWSYLDGQGLLGQQYNLGGDYVTGSNWCVDAANPYAPVWSIRNDSLIYTDGRDIGACYTVDTNEGGELQLNINATSSSAATIQLLVVRDGDMTQIIWADVEVLYTGSNDSPYSTTVTLNPGDDIVFMVVNSSVWWYPVALTGEILAVPEPLTAVLLAGGFGLAVLRKKKKI